MNSQALKHLISSGSRETRRLNSAKQVIPDPSIPVEVPLQEKPAHDSAKRIFRVTVAIPDKRLNPNTRCHWAAKARIVKKTRTAAMLACVIQTRLGQPMKRASIQVRWYAKTNARADSDNRQSSLKSVADGICDAKIIENDHGIRWEPMENYKDAKNLRVELVITEI